MVLKVETPAFIAFELCQEEWQGRRCMTAVTSDACSTYARGWSCLTCGAPYAAEFGMVVRIRGDNGVRFYKAGLPPDDRFRDIIVDIPEFADIPEPDVTPFDVSRTDVLQFSLEHAGGVFRISETVFESLPIYDWHPLMAALERFLWR